MRNVKKKLLLRKIIIIFLFVSLFALWSVYYLVQSDFFELRKILINGNSAIANEEILKLSEIEINRNILKYNMTHIENLIAAHPYIKSVEVKRKLLNTIIIDITERTEYAIIVYMGSNIYIDKEARILRIDDSYFKQALPLITSVELLDFQIGDFIEVENSNKFARALQIIEAAKTAEILYVISEISLREEYLRIITVSGNEIMISESACPIYLMLALKEVLNKLYSNNRKNVIIDMRHEGAITVRERDIQEEN